MFIKLWTRNNDDTFRTGDRKRFTMTMATNPQNKSRRCRNPNIYETYKHPKNDDEFRTGDRQVLRWLWPHQPTQRIQKIHNSEILINRWTLDNDDAFRTGDRTKLTDPQKSTYLWNLWPFSNDDMSRTRDRQIFTIAMATDPKNKSRRCRIPNIYEPNQNLKTGTHSEPGARKYLRRLCPPTLKTNPEDAEIQAFMKPVNT